MEKDIDLSSTSLEFPDVECGGDIEAGPNISCIVCVDDCKGCVSTCKECVATCIRDICG